jgi:cell division protein FtsB
MSKNKADIEVLTSQLKSMQDERAIVSKAIDRLKKDKQSLLVKEQTSVAIQQLMESKIKTLNARLREREQENKSLKSEKEYLSKSN